MGWKAQSFKQYINIKKQGSAMGKKEKRRTEPGSRLSYGKTFWKQGDPKSERARLPASQPRQPHHMKEKK